MCLRSADCRSVLELSGQLRRDGKSGSHQNCSAKGRDGAGGSAAAAGQEGLENAALPVPGILSWMIWDVPHIYQYDSYPTGCESVSAVCALRYSGVILRWMILLTNIW